MREEIKDERRQRIGYVDRQLNGKVTIYDKMNMRLGEIRPEGRRLVAYDKMNRKIAYWDETNDSTFEPNGRKITKGNILVGMYFQR